LCEIQQTMTIFYTLISRLRELFTSVLHVFPGNDFLSFSLFRAACTCVSECRHQLD